MYRVIKGSTAVTSTTYVLVNDTTGKAVGYTTIGAFDVDWDCSDEELLEVRLEDAIGDGVIADDSYTWKKSNRKVGVLL